jgi:hypothetical protein
MTVTCSFRLTCLGIGRHQSQHGSPPKYGKSTQRWIVWLEPSDPGTPQCQTRPPQDQDHPYNLTRERQSGQTAGHGHENIESQAKEVWQFGLSDEENILTQAEEKGGKMEARRQRETTEFKISDHP